ncbi:hypothetical protein LCGC14_1767520 [marine sediment metagenome]|uniref:Uncharacterized protein n=1 Tax=marine sediment metagenome TaxID=412755 RepID=A0A0F9GZ84_9ZZZZ
MIMWNKLRSMPSYLLIFIVGLAIGLAIAMVDPGTEVTAIPDGMICFQEVSHD